MFYLEVVLVLVKAQFGIVLGFLPRKNGQSWIVKTRGGILPSKRLLGMCRWMGSHFHNRPDYNGVTFLVELFEWGRKFSGFLG